MFREGSIIKLIVGLFLLMFISSGLTKASEAGDSTILRVEHKKFDAGSFIFDHIGDSHDWHITDIGHISIRIPLPVILYSKDKGVVAFWSTRFYHGNAEYKGFRLETEGVNKGKIIQTLADGTEVIPFDLSITKNVAALFFSAFLILVIFISLGNVYKKRGNKAPRGFQSLVEPVILFIRDEVARPSIGDKNYEKFMPFLLTVFFFIWINNMLGLVPLAPGGANVTGNIAITLVLALCTFTITAINGSKQYWKHIINTPGVPIWLKIPVPLLPLVETIGLFTKPFVLMVRLFANITAGHIITLGFLSLIFLFGEIQPFIGYGVSVVSVLFIMFMTLLELLIAFIQAYVFTFLSAIYFGMAIEEHH
jgi:F-type H+-transporting ATPase subunit a